MSQAVIRVEKNCTGNAINERVLAKIYILAKNIVKESANSGFSATRCFIATMNRFTLL